MKNYVLDWNKKLCKIISKATNFSRLRSNMPKQDNFQINFLQLLFQVNVTAIYFALILLCLLFYSIVNLTLFQKLLMAVQA